MFRLLRTRGLQVPVEKACHQPRRAVAWRAARDEVSKTCARETGPVSGESSLGVGDPVLRASGAGWHEADGERTWVYLKV